MNKPAWLFGTTTLLLGGSCLYLLLQPRGESAQPGDELRGQLRAERDRLETDVRSLRAAHAGPATRPQPSAAASTLATAPAPPPPGLFRTDIPPKTRRTMMRLRHGKIFRQLGLTAAQQESLLDVLSAQEERALAVKPGTLNPSLDSEQRARNRAEVEAVIGREGAEKLELWQQQLLTRFEMRRVRDQLEDVGEPLSDAQLSRINELVSARPVVVSPTRQQDESPEAFMERWKSWRNDSREQLRGEVSSVLEPRQLERYDEMDEVTRAFEKAMPPRPMMALPTAGAAALPAPR